MGTRVQNSTWIPTDEREFMICVDEAHRFLEDLYEAGTKIDVSRVCMTDLGRTLTILDKYRRDKNA